MAKEEDISLREFLEEKIKNLEEKVMMLNASNEKALILKAEENKVHFEKLNGEYARIDKIVVDRVPRELYEQTNKELNGKIDDLILKNENNITRNELAAMLQTPSADIKTLTSHKDVGIGKWTATVAIVLFILSLIGAAGGIISLFK